MVNMRSFWLWLTLGLVATFSNSGAYAALKSEIENPFRFFKFPSDYAVQRMAYDLELGRTGVTLANIDVAEIQKRLNSREFWTHSIAAAERAKWPKTWVGSNPLQIVESLRQKEGRQSIIAAVRQQGLSAVELIERFGWASLLDTHRGAAETAVCWNRAERDYSNCENYVTPKSWRVRVFDDQRVGGICKWELGEGAKFPNNQSRTITGDCDEILVEVLSSTPGQTLSEPNGRTSIVRIDPQNVRSSPLEVIVKDQLVVGLGDSYSSGEGNPDRPVYLSSTIAAGDALLPRRPDDNLHWAAHWVDRACHRSIYSWQFRSAIHQTLTNPNAPITYLSFACSGAEVVEGLLYPWSGPEETPNTSFQSQLASIYEELCAIDTEIPVSSIPKIETDKFLDNVANYPWQANENKLVSEAIGKLKCKAGPAPSTNPSFVRPINSILLSIGGNDLGFARWIAAAIADGLIDTGFIPRLTDCNATGDAQDECDLTEARIERLKSRFAVLRRVLVAAILRDGGLASTKVLVVSYPKATNGRNALVCPEGNEGMTVSVGLSVFNKAFAIRDKDELTTIEWFRHNKLANAVQAFTTSATTPFKFIDSFVNDFERHGFCATAIASEASGQDLDKADLFKATLLNGNEVAETLHMPRIGSARYRGGRAVSESLWRPFKPEQWRAYSSRSRWLRTPNDVFMTVNNKPSVLEQGNIIGILDMRNRGSSGAFHPTAEGHAAIAKKVIPFLKEALQ